MKNIERQKALEKARLLKGVECGQEIYCKFCQNESECACAKAFNRMQYKKANQPSERERYMWGD